MKNRRKGIHINSKTFRVLPDELVKMWWARELDATTLMIWLSLQLIAVEHHGVRMTYRQISRICRVSQSTLAASLKKLVEKGLLERTHNGFTVVFEPEARASKIEAGASKIEARASKIEASASKIEAQMSSHRPGELKRDIESHGETPTPRPASRNGFVASTMGGASADSSSTYSLSETDLAALERRYGISFSSLSDSPAVRVAIRALLDGDESKKEFALALLQVLAARGDAEFAGAGGSSPAKRH